MLSMIHTKVECWSANNLFVYLYNCRRSRKVDAPTKQLRTFNSFASNVDRKDARRGETVENDKERNFQGQPVKMCVLRVLIKRTDATVDHHSGRRERERIVTIRPAITATN